MTDSADVRQTTISLDNGIRLTADARDLIDALQAISDYHIPDCPSHFAGDEVAWAQRQHAYLRSLARAALARAKEGQP